jgi:hypothetical protein
MVYYRNSKDPKDYPPEAIKQKIAKGVLVVKSGKGFYSYPDPEYLQDGFLSTEDQMILAITYVLPQIYLPLRLVPAFRWHWQSHRSVYFTLPARSFLRIPCTVFSKNNRLSPSLNPYLSRIANS